jgi:hypothetical protein
MQKELFYLLKLAGMRAGAAFLFAAYKTWEFRVALCGHAETFCTALHSAISHH